MRAVGPMRVSRSVVLRDRSVVSDGEAVDHARRRERDDAHPLRVAGAVLHDEIRVLERGHVGGVRLPEGRIDVGGNREDHLGVGAGDALREVVKRVVDDVEERFPFGAPGFRRLLAAAGCEEMGSE